MNAPAEAVQIYDALKLAVAFALTCTTLLTIYRLSARAARSL